MSNIMKSFQVEAFVLRLRPLGEADRILHLFSRERGKLHAVAKGVRRPRSKFGARLDLFSRTQLTIHAARSLPIITAARQVGNAWERMVDPDAFAACSYAAEVVDALCEPDLPVSDLFDLFAELQDALLAGARPDALLPAFDLRALGALGFSPELDACTRCGAPLGKRPLAHGRARLSPDGGGLICERCYQAERTQAAPSGIFNVSARELALLRDLRCTALREAAEANLPAALLHRLARTTHAFVEFNMGRSSRALKAAAGRQ